MRGYQNGAQLLGSDSGENDTLNPLDDSVTPVLDSSVPCEQSRHATALFVAFGVSVALHLLALFAVWLLPVTIPGPEPVEASVTVQIVTEPSAPVVRASTPSPIPAAPPPVPTSVQSTTEAGSMIHAQKLFSAKMLADPRSKSARRALRHLARIDRIIQLCDVEAMEQVHNWRPVYQPDLVVAYAMADVKLSGLTLEAGGGALREKERWHAMKFKCEVTADLEKVVAFDFLMGAEIPASQWEAHSLPSGDDAD